MMEGLTLRPASQRDYDFLYQLHRSAMMDAIAATWGWDEPWQQDYFQEHFDPAGRRVIMLSGEAIGVISIEERDAALYLALIEIDPGFQGRGIGSALLGQFKEMARAAGIPAALHVLKVNNRALRLYEREGFRIIGVEEKKYYMWHDPKSADQSQT